MVQSIFRFFPLFSLSLPLDEIVRVRVCLNRQLVCNLNNTIKNNQSVNPIHMGGSRQPYFALVKQFHTWESPSFIIFLCMFEWFYMPNHIFSAQYYFCYHREKNICNSNALFLLLELSSLFRYWGYFFPNIERSVFFSFKSACTLCLANIVKLDDVVSILSPKVKLKWVYIGKVHRRRPNWCYKCCKELRIKKMRLRLSSKQFFHLLNRGTVIFLWDDVKRTVDATLPAKHTKIWTRRQRQNSVYLYEHTHIIYLVFTSSRVSFFPFRQLFYDLLWFFFCIQYENICSYLYQT